MNSGRSIIKAFGPETRFIEELSRRTDENHSYNLASFVANRILGFYADLAGNFIILSAAIFSVYNRGDIVSASLAGLALSYAISVV